MVSSDPAHAQAPVVPPAAAVIPEAPPAAPADAARQTPATPKMQYSEVAPGLLERSVFTTTAAGSLAVSVDDVLVGPGDSVQIPASQFAALIGIEAGAPSLSVDDKPVDAAPGALISIDQGHVLTIDNRQQQRGAVARLIKLQLQGN